MTKIDYHFSITPKACFDGQTIPYFVSKGFNTAHLVVWDQTMPSDAIAKLKANKLNVIVDIEQPIWAGGAQQWQPISNFAEYFRMLRAIGVEYVSSEGGRDNDLDFMRTYFKGYVNYNCDQCGLWKGFHKHPLTVTNSWESYYTWQWAAIQQGIHESQGKKQGILAGVWEGSVNPILTATKANTGLTFYDMARWINANSSTGLDHFAVWAGLNDGMMWRYKELGFEKVVANMQAIFPPKPVGNGPLPPPIDPEVGVNHNPVTKIGCTLQHFNTGLMKIYGHAYDAKGAATSRPIGLWEQIEGKWTGQKWTKSDNKGYFDFVISDLAPGVHQYRIQTSDRYSYEKIPLIDLRR